VVWGGGNLSLLDVDKLIARIEYEVVRKKCLIMVNSRNPYLTGSSLTTCLFIS